MELLEVFRVVRNQEGLVFTTPSKQLSVVRVLAELVFGLDNVIATVSKDVLENSADVFVEKQRRSRTHEIGSLGFSDDSRTASNAASFLRS